MSLELSPETQIRLMLEENKRLLQEIQKNTERTRKYIFWSQVWSMVRLVIIILPIIAGVLYLRPFLQEAFSKYQELINGGVSDSFKSSLENQ